MYTYEYICIKNLNFYFTLTVFLFNIFVKRYYYREIII